MNRELKFRAWDNTKLEWIDVRECSYTDLFEDEKYIVQQWTGLKDSKGVDVYEGDIIEAGNGIVYFCEYSEDEAGYILKYDDSFVYLPDFNTLKVIGNIFENSELLKQ